MDRFRELNKDELAVGTFVVDDKYGMAGKYYFVIGADGLPLPPPQAATAAADRVLSGPASRSVTRPRRGIGRSGSVRLPGVAVADVDGDGDLDLLLTGQGANGAAQILLNDGTGQFTRGATLADRVACPCFGDLDNDGDVDLWLGRAGADQVLLNDGKGTVHAVHSRGTLPALTRSPSWRDWPTSTATVTWICWLFAVRPATFPRREPTRKPAPSSVFFSNTDGTFVDRAADLGLQFADTLVAAVAYDDFDNDFDLDLVVFPAPGTAGGVGELPCGPVSDRAR